MLIGRRAVSGGRIEPVVCVFKQAVPLIAPIARRQSLVGVADAGVDVCNDNVLPGDVQLVPHPIGLDVGQVRFDGGRGWGQRKRGRGGLDQV